MLLLSLTLSISYKNCIFVVLTLFILFRLKECIHGKTFDYEYGNKSLIVRKTRKKRKLNVECVLEIICNIFLFMCYIIAVYVRFNVKLKQVNRASWTHDNTC